MLARTPVKGFLSVRRRNRLQQERGTGTVLIKNLHGATSARLRRIKNLWTTARASSLRSLEADTFETLKQRRMILGA